MRRKLDKLIAADARKTLKIKTAVRVGKPYEQIVQHAVQEQIDMIAMAARGAEALDRAVFGSTTYRVVQLDNAPCSRFTPDPDPERRIELV